MKSLNNVVLGKWNSIKRSSETFIKKTIWVALGLALMFILAYVLKTSAKVLWWALVMVGTASIAAFGILRNVGRRARAAIVKASI